MAQSKQYKQTIKLGKKIADELGLEQSSDTLGRWMSHHIAELIEMAEQAPLSERAQKQEQCRTAIIELWDHISSVPPVSNPFIDLEPIITTVRTLDPNKSTHFYQTRAQEVVEASNLSGAAKEWLKLSRCVDHSARLLIRLCLNQVMAETSGKLREWIELATDSGANELPVLRFVRAFEEDAEFSSRETEWRKKELQERLKCLQDLVKLSEMLANDIQMQIEKIEHS